MSKSDSIMTAIMLGNASIATFNAVEWQEPIFAFVAYISWSPVVVAMKWVDPSWLYIYTEGKRSKYIRDLLLWPLTIYEYVTMTRMLFKAAEIARKHQAMGTPPSYKELKYLAKIARKTQKFRDSYERMQKGQ